MTTTIVLPKAFPTTFAPFKRGRHIVTGFSVTEKWRTTTALPLVAAPHNHTLLLSTQDLTRKQRKLFGPSQTAQWLLRNDEFTTQTLASLQNDGNPKYMLMRWPEAVSVTVAQKLFRRWDRLCLAGVQFPAAEVQRSSTPALHLGLWALSSSSPHYTADTLQKQICDPVKRGKVIGKMDKLGALVKKEVIPHLIRLMAEYAPEQTRVQNLIHEKVQGYLQSVITARPAMYFGPLFYTMAVKEGSSEKVHIDWNDSMQKYAIVFCVGDYTGADFCVPQLDVRVPFPPRAAMAVQTRLLAHCATVVGSGRRLVFTCFTDCTLLEQVLKGRDWAHL
ncbi:hypothetical protein FB45DRAFT_904332 [Roridomyces roridus]|uniref:Uncharacterized protein n=1 Tax=Roridomyces roridus TaxID=1738132 RepID=A0AAD7C4W6_9AGAR|nr:hypothetical protein FB45DRAFT_904332 [Roridomyces roridus]